MASSSSKLPDQTHIERLFRVLFMLKSVRRYTTREIADTLDISTRTVQRYVEEFRNIGFEIECDRDCYRLSTSNPRNKALFEIVAGTSEMRTLNNLEELNAAIQMGRCVRLVGYASGHGSSVCDREVEPFEITADKKYVWCYDPSEGYCKTFRPSRCQSVQILTRGWRHSAEFQSENIDIFGFHGTEPIRIKIELDVMAHNLLLEQNPEAALEMTESGTDRWTLDTNVYEIWGVGRFCMGLIGHFTIIDAPALTEYMNSKCGEWVG